MRLPQAVVSSHPANTTDFIDDGAYQQTHRHTYDASAILTRQVASFTYATSCYNLQTAMRLHSTLLT